MDWLRKLESTRHHAAHWNDVINESPRALDQPVNRRDLLASGTAAALALTGLFAGHHAEEKREDAIVQELQSLKSSDEKLMLRKLLVYVKDESSDLALMNKFLGLIADMNLQAYLIRSKQDPAKLKDPILKACIKQGDNQTALKTIQVLAKEKSGAGDVFEAKAQAMYALSLIIDPAKLAD